jgi:hypothetical protein
MDERDFCASPRSVDACYRSAMPLAHLISLVVALAHAADQPWQPLFNGKDLAGWETYLSKPEREWDVPGLKRDADGTYLEPIGKNRDPLQVFTVTTIDGRPAIRISGQGLGVLTTTPSFTNYHLRLQFKWGEQRWAPRADAVRDSGLLYHVHGDAGAIYRVWPRSVEFQIQEHDVGDLFALGTRISVPVRADPGKPRNLIYDPNGTPTLFLDNGPVSNRAIRERDAEKPRGEWNTIELISLNGDSIHIVNGQVVMRLHHAERLDDKQPVPLRSGAIALQTEGAEIFYRDIEIREITEIPAEFSER